MSEMLVLSDVNGICRLCLKCDGTIIPIFGRENTSRDCIHLSKKILDCVSVKVAEGDGMPSMICVGCVHQVDSWHGFKNTCDSSQKKLNSWLQKTKPEVFEKNQAANRQEKISNSRKLKSQSLGIIDVSSDDDDDVVITTHTEPRRSMTNVQRIRNRLSRSVGSKSSALVPFCNEIEILPVPSDEVVCLDGNSSKSSQREADSTLIHQLPKLVSNASVESNIVSANSSEDHILPDTEIPPILSALDLTETPKENKETKDLEQNPKDSTAHSKSTNEALADVSIEEVQMNESELSPTSVNEDNHTEDPIGDSQISKNELSVKPNEEDGENSIIDNSSSLVIEKVTSLTNQESGEMGEGTISKEQAVVLEEENGHKDYAMDVETVESRGASNNEEDLQDMRPDIVMCDTPMVIHIKEEPMSADEVTEDENDPLNFHSITIKRESTDGFVEEMNEPEDIKPNLQQLKEVMESQYTPKRLKSGKVHCEACRVSFLNDVCYEKHTLSLRHKINLKLFRSGKAPTRSRGKALIKAIMGSSNECPKPKVKGYFQCNQCPSRYLHARNLTTHQKKHKIEMQNTAKDVQKGPDFHEVSESSQDSTQSSKPPQRLSALNVKFVTKEELKCELCNRYFGTTSALYSHRRYCGFSGSHNCSRCNQKFSTQSLMFKHRKECVSFYRKQSLISHQRQSNNIPTNIPSQEIPQVPLDGTVLACTLCNLTFRNSPDLISHMQLNHMDFGKQKSAFEVPTFNEPNNISRKNNSQMHYCKYCMKSFSSQMSMSCHTGYHARARLYYCKFCPENYMDKLMLRQHMKIHIADPSLNKNICWICYTPFASQQDLIDHKNIHVNMKIKIFSCSICGNSYNTKELLVKHRKNTHRSQKPIEDFDASQSEPFPEIVIKETAVQLIDEDYKLFKCRICKKKFCSKGNLRRHSLVHKRAQNIDMSIVKVENPFQNRCNWCLQSFKNNVGLANHRPFCVRYKIASAPLSSFTGKGPVKCKGCKKWYSSKSSLYKHRKRCTMKPSVQTNMVEINHLITQNCPNCDQQFLSEESLNRHKQHCKPSIDRVTCDCGEIFTSVEQKLAHADSCPANCTCKTCSLKFNSPEELESHQSICQSQPLLSPPAQSSFPVESRSPSVGCSKCNKKFVYSKCLKLHEEKCLNESWPCQICNEVFTSEVALSNHKKYRGQCQNSQIVRSPSTSSLNEGPTFKCEHCSMMFISGNELKQHSINCGKKSVVKRRNYNASFEERRFSCDQCDKRFLWSANLYRHKKNSHATTLPANENSDNKTVSSTTGSPARPNQEGGSGYFRCHLCPEIIFHKKQGFLEHQLAHNRQLEKSIVDQIENEDSDLLTCELCEKKLPESLYHMHMDEHMNDDFEETHTAIGNQAENSSTPVQTFPCDLCGKEFHSNSSRKSHRAAHFRNNSVFGIDGLSSKKEQKMAYKRRFKAKHVRCMTCYKLLSVNSMPKHKMMHHREAAEFFGEGQSKSSQQAPIPRSSSPTLNDSPDQNGSGDLNITPESLLSLRLEDTGEVQQTFPCPKCDRIFIIRKTLTEHLKVHQDDSMETESTSSATGNVDQYTYKCVYCDLSWKYKSVYERHLSSKKHLEIQKQLSSII